MWSVLAAVGIGLAVGLMPGSQRLKKLNKHLGTFGLLLLLGSMGVELGGSEELFASLGQIGLSAVVLACFAVIGSVLMVLPLRRAIGRTSGTEESETTR